MPQGPSSPEQLACGEPPPRGQHSRPSEPQAVGRCHWAQPRVTAPASGHGSPVLRVFAEPARGWGPDACMLTLADVMGHCSIALMLPLRAGNHGAWLSSTDHGPHNTAPYDMPEPRGKGHGPACRRAGPTYSWEEAGPAAKAAGLGELSCLAQQAHTIGSSAARGLG